LDIVASVTQLEEIADRYVDAWAALDPIGATIAGLAGFDDRLTDYSPEGFDARSELDRRALAEIGPIEPASERERVAKEAMQERLGLALEMDDAGERASRLNVIHSPLHAIRGVFDLMPLAGEAAAAEITARLAGTPAALAAWKRTLLVNAQAGQVAARSQMIEVANQCDTWVGEARDNFFPALAERVRRANGDLPPGLAADLERAAAAARAATADIARFLREELAPLGRANPAAGVDRYRLHSRAFLGARIDFEEAYAWAFDELARLEGEMRAIADKIVPGGTVAEAVAALDADPARNIAGKDAFQRWMQELAEQAIDDLHGTHFDIPAPVRRIEACIAPTSDGAIYYTKPSEDFTRPGRMWWAVPEGIETFSTWREVTTVYHEGVPGHHLQIGQTVFRAELLNRWQRLLCWVSGHGEGWALYAERLMDELGYLADPGDRLGMLDAQALRAARVVVDLGMHLELAVPRDNQFGLEPGQRFTPQLGWEFMRAHCMVPDETLRFELNRYLGWPGQAPSYKLGERIWLRARDEAKRRQGAAFDLRAFHRDALNLGSVGLDVMEAAIARL
jgi:uncharacterized protein (DUF885 family)